MARTYFAIPGRYENTPLPGQQVARAYFAIPGRIWVVKVVLLFLGSLQLRPWVLQAALSIALPTSCLGQIGTTTPSDSTNTPPLALRLCPLTNNLHRPSPKQIQPRPNLSRSQPSPAHLLSGLPTAESHQVAFLPPTSVLCRFSLWCPFGRHQPPWSTHLLQVPRTPASWGSSR